MAMAPEAMDIDRYLPFKSIASIESFCSDDDGLLCRRKHGLLRRIQSGVITKDNSKFIASLSRLLFDADFVIEHKWPVKKLVVIQKTKTKKKWFHLILFFSPNKNFSKLNPTPLPSVPQVLVSLLETTIQKLIGLNLLGVNMSVPDIFAKMRVKFSNASKKVIFFINHFFNNKQYQIFNFYLCKTAGGRKISLIRVIHFTMFIFLANAIFFEVLT